jgi:hypothetical protein
LAGFFRVEGRASLDTSYAAAASSAGGLFVAVALAVTHSLALARHENPFVLRHFDIHQVSPRSGSQPFSKEGSSGISETWTNRSGEAQMATTAEKQQPKKQRKKLKR